MKNIHSYSHKEWRFSAEEEILFSSLTDMHHRSIPQIRTHTNNSYLILAIQPCISDTFLPWTRCRHVASLFFCRSTTKNLFVKSKHQVKGIRSGLMYFQFLLFVTSAVSPHLTLLSSLAGKICWITDGRIDNHSLSVTKCRQTVPTNLCSVFLY